MTSASRARGSAWELALLKWFREHGLGAERLRLTGRKDEGDLAVVDTDLTYVIEAKNVQRIALADFVDQALLERDHYSDARLLGRAKVMPLAIIKRRGHSVEDAYVVTTVAEFFTA